MNRIFLIVLAVSIVVIVLAQRYASGGLLSVANWALGVTISAVVTIMIFKSILYLYRKSKR